MSASLRARDGIVVRVEVERSALTVIAEAPDGARRSASIPYPSAGYGGHELVLSPCEKYLAMWLYSGQSEVGYEVFSWPALEHVGRCPYESGTGSEPVFSPDDRCIAMAWATRSGLTLDEAELDDDGLTVAEEIVEWARVRVEELPGGPTRTWIVHVRVPAGFPFEGDERYDPEELEVAGDEVRFRAPWGVRARLSSSANDPVVIEGPTAR